MAGSYVTAGKFRDRAGLFLKFQKNRHIAASKIAVSVRFGSTLKLAVFGLKTATALKIMHFLWSMIFTELHAMHFNHR